MGDWILINEVLASCTRKYLTQSRQGAKVQKGDSPLMTPIVRIFADFLFHPRPSA